MPAARRRVAALQIQETGAAVFLAWIAIHTPSATAVLALAAAVLLGWVAIADGPLGVAPVVGLEVHRFGLLVLGAGIAGLPFPTGHASDVVVVVSCLLAAALLVRGGLTRAGEQTGPDAQRSPRPETPGQTGNEQSVTAGKNLLHGVHPTIRRAGRAAGRAGTVVARQADVAVPKGARAAGKVAGRLRAPRP